MKKSQRQLIIQFSLLFLVFFFFAIFRFYNLDKRIIFDWDQERDANIIKQLLVDHKLTLIGPRVVSESGFFLGPYFTYLLAPFYLLTNLHPQGLIYFIIFYNIIFFAFSYLILKKIYGLNQSLGFLFLWAINFLLVEYDVIPWNSILIPLGVVMTWLFLYRIFKNNATEDWFLLGLVLGFFVNMHFQFIFMILFSAFFLVLYQIKKKAFDLKKIFVAKLSFLAMFIPLLIFDLRHNFINGKQFINFFFTNLNKNVFDPFAWIPVLTNFFYPLLLIKNTLLTVVFYLLLITTNVVLIKRSKNFFKIFYLSSLILLVITPIFFILYGKRPSEYYFLYLYPFIFILLIQFFLKFKAVRILYLLVLLNLIFSYGHLKRILKVNLLGLLYKDKIVTTIKKDLGNRSSDISRDLGIGRDTGFGYLIDYYKLNKRKGKVTDQVQIRFPPQKHDLIIGEYGINYSWQNK